MPMMDNESDREPERESDSTASVLDCVFVSWRQEIDRIIANTVNMNVFRK